MSRIAHAFERRRAEGGAALVTYVMGGDPDPRGSLAFALACVAGGADLLELGIPFSDPIADGPTLQRAAERALAAGTRLSDCLRIASQVRRRSDIPIALMGYLNPVLAHGEEKFFAACQRAGVDAVILPDLPPEEADGLLALSRAHGVSLVFLLSPTSTERRRREVFAKASGFVYYVSVTGVTGARTALPQDLAQRVAQVRAESPLPVAVGFGISTPEQAAMLGAHADGVVVGSAIVSRASGQGPVRERAGRVERFVRSLKRALAPTPASRRKSRC